MMIAKAKEPASEITKLQKWGPVTLVGVAYLHLFAYLLFVLVCRASFLTFGQEIYLWAHGAVLLLFFVVGVTPCKEYLKKVESWKHSEP
ncbi:MAG: hypothetical protein OXC19_06260 [Bryobacterales bacterium]|nr:hypothetical protein [Bryobacterales bacterium]